MVVVAAGALLLKAFAGIDVAAAWRAVAAAGRLAPLALAPFAVGMALDATGIGILLRALGRRVPPVRLMAIRVATEALHLTAPAGFVVADSATAALLDTRCGVPMAEGAVIAIARKWLVTRAHAAYIVLGAVCGAAALTGVSGRVLGARWLAWAVAASALAPLSLSLALGAGFRGQPALARLQRALGRIPWRALRDRVSRWRCGAVAVDGHLARVGTAHAATRLATASYFACWLVEAFETALILRLVGGPLNLGLAMTVEVGVSLVRSIRKRRAGGARGAGRGLRGALRSPGHAGAHDRGVRPSQERQGARVDRRGLCAPRGDAPARRARFSSDCSRCRSIRADAGALR